MLSLLYIFSKMEPRSEPEKKFFVDYLRSQSLIHHSAKKSEALGEENSGRFSEGNRRLPGGEASDAYFIAFSVAYSVSLI